MTIGCFCIQFNCEDPRMRAVANMATSSGINTQTFSSLEVAQIISYSQNDTQSDIDSENGGISSDEEYELDDLQGEIDLNSEERSVCGT